MAAQVLDWRKNKNTN